MIEHIARCDRCGKIQDAVTNAIQFTPPKGWKNLEYGRLLCPSCTKKHDEWMKDGKRTANDREEKKAS